MLVCTPNVLKEIDLRPSGCCNLVRAQRLTNDAIIKFSPAIEMAKIFHIIVKVLSVFHLRAHDHDLLLHDLDMWTYSPCAFLLRNQADTLLELLRIHLAMVRVMAHKWSVVTVADAM